MTNIFDFDDPNSILQETRTAAQEMVHNVSESAKKHNEIIKWVLISGAIFITLLIMMIIAWRLLK